MEHPAEDILRRFLLASTTPQENCQVVRHLLTRCPSCAAALRLMKQPPPPGAYDQALAQLAARLRELTCREKPPPVNLFSSL